MVREYPGSSPKRRSSPLSEYTIEDYFKDFELDYLGFDGVPDKPGSDPSPETPPEDGTETKAVDPDKDDHRGTEGDL